MRRVETLKAAQGAFAGNALFLILIAVALFAALAYAVTQSSRGGGNTDRELMQLKIARVLQQAALMQNAVNRLYVLGTVEQISGLSTAAYTASGTVELPDGSTKTGATVGLYNSTYGIEPQTPPQDIFVLGSGNWQYFNTYNFVFGGQNLGGTTGDDEVISLGGLTQEACEAINRALFGDPTESTGSGPSGGNYTYTHSGCGVWNGTDRWYSFPLKTN